MDPLSREGRESAAEAFLAHRSSLGTVSGSGSRGVRVNNATLGGTSRTWRLRGSIVRTGFERVGADSRLTL